MSGHWKVWWALKRKSKVDPIVEQTVRLGSFLRHALHRGKTHEGTADLVRLAKEALLLITQERRKENENRVPITRAQLNAMVRLHEAGTLPVEKLKRQQLDTIWRPLTYRGLIATDWSVPNSPGSNGWVYLTEFGLNELGWRGLIDPLSEHD